MDCPYYLPADVYCHSDWQQNSKHRALDVTSKTELAVAAESVKRTFYWNVSRSWATSCHITKIIALQNTQLSRLFKGRLDVMATRMNEPAFQPAWKSMSDVPLRGMVMRRLKSLLAGSSNRVKFLLTWHGCSQEDVVKIADSGFAALGTTDAGFFGKGIYSTTSAEYACRVYGHGVVILSCVSVGNTLPVVFSDQDSLLGKGSFGNCDSHYAAVVPRSDNPQETVFDACRSGQIPVHDEVVVFHENQILPMFAVYYSTGATAPTKSLSTAPIPMDVLQLRQHYDICKAELQETKLLFQQSQSRVAELEKQLSAKAPQEPPDEFVLVRPSLVPKSRPACAFFPLGACTKGDSCAFDHTVSAAPTTTATALNRDADAQNALIETLRASVKTFEEKRVDLEAKVASFQGIPDAGQERRQRQQAELELLLMRQHVLQMTSEQEQAMEALRRRVALLDQTCRDLKHDNDVVNSDYKYLREKYDQVKSARVSALAQVANIRASVQSSDDELRQAMRMADSTESKLADIAKILAAVDKVAESDRQQAQQTDLLERALTDLSTRVKQKQSELRNMEHSQQQLRAKLHFIYGKRLESRPVQASVTGAAAPPPATAPPATKPAAVRRTESASTVETLEASTAARRPSAPSSQQQQQQVIARGRTSELSPASPPMIGAPIPVTSAKLAVPIAGALRQRMAPSAAYRTRLTSLPAAATEDDEDDPDSTQWI